MSNGSLQESCLKCSFPPTLPVLVASQCAHLPDVGVLVRRARQEQRQHLGPILGGACGKARQGGGMGGSPGIDWSACMACSVLHAANAGAAKATGKGFSLQRNGNASSPAVHWPPGPRQVHRPPSSGHRAWDSQQQPPAAGRLQRLTRGRELHHLVHDADGDAPLLCSQRRVAPESGQGAGRRMAHAGAMFAQAADRTVRS